MEKSIFTSILYINNLDGVVLGNRKHQILIVVIVCFVSVAQVWGVAGPADIDAIGEQPVSGPVAVDSPDVAHLMSKMGGHFTENLGQVDNGNVRFYASGDPLSVGLTNDGVVFTLRESASDVDVDFLASNGPVGGTTVFSLSIEGCNRVDPVGISPLLSLIHI